MHITSYHDKLKLKKMCVFVCVYLLLEYDSLILCRADVSGEIRMLGGTWTATHLRKASAV